MMLVILKEKMIDPVTLAVINGRLEQISGWLSQEPGQQVSHEWIYQYVYADKRRGGDLHAHLRCQKKRRKRYGSNDRRGQIRGRVSIDERPEIVEERSRTGDWEADTVIGQARRPCPAHACGAQDTLQHHCQGSRQVCTSRHGRPAHSTAASCRPCPHAHL